jgi:hypothetical protein
MERMLRAALPFAARVCASRLGVPTALRAAAPSARALPRRYNVREQLLRQPLSRPVNGTVGGAALRQAVRSVTTSAAPKVRIRRAREVACLARLTRMLLFALPARARPHDRTLLKRPTKMTMMAASPTLATRARRCLRRRRNRRTS